MAWRENSVRSAWRRIEIIRPSPGRLALAAVLGLAACAAMSAQGQRLAGDSFQRAVAALKAGKLEDAEKGFTQAIRFEPGFAQAYLNLGLVLAEQQRYPEATAKFAKALALKPQLRGANLFLGIAEYRLDQLDKAVASATRETVLNPMDAAAWMWLGIIRLAQEQPEAAALALDKAAELAPKDADVLYHRGRAHLL